MFRAVFARKRKVFRISIANFHRASDFALRLADGVRNRPVRQGGKLSPKICTPTRYGSAFFGGDATIFREPLDLPSAFGKFWVCRRAKYNRMPIQLTTFANLHFVGGWLGVIGERRVFSPGGVGFSARAVPYISEFIML